MVGRGTVAAVSTVVLGFLPAYAARLVLLLTLTRHGSRAPNDIADELCPLNWANRRLYNVPPGQLTEKGMQQALQLGEQIRSLYVEDKGFLPPSFSSGGASGFFSKFQSDPALRCLQTAQACAMGIYSQGTGPPGLPTQPVPVSTHEKGLDNLFAAPNAACKPQRLVDNKVYDNGRGRELVEEASTTMSIVGEACGLNIEDYAAVHGGEEGLVLGVKDVSDMFNFDQQQGLDILPLVNAEVHANLSQLAFQLLQERYYTRPEQVTYWAGGMPEKILGDLEAGAAKDQESNGEPLTTRYHGYHAHRELLYGVGHLLGWRFNIEGMPHALGTSAIPPGTTMFFELHGPDEMGQDEREASQEFEGYNVRVFTWTPDHGRQEVFLEKCGAQLLTLLISEGEGCPLTRLRLIVSEHVAATGTWEEICHHMPCQEAEHLVQSEGRTEHNAGGGGGSASSLDGFGESSSGCNDNGDKAWTLRTIFVVGAASVSCGAVAWLIASRAKARSYVGLHTSRYSVVV